MYIEMFMYVIDKYSFGMDWIVYVWDKFEFTTDMTEYIDKTNRYMNKRYNDIKSLQYNRIFAISRVECNMSMVNTVLNVL